MYSDNQNVRIEIANNKALNSRLAELFPREDHRYLYGNLGVVIISKIDNKVYKIYLDKESGLREQSNYDLLANIVITPKILKSGMLNIPDFELFFLNIENIRLNNKKFISFSEINPKSLGKFITKVHSIKKLNGKYNIHGNLHSSNFYLNENNELGIFDLASMRLGEIELDFSTVFNNCNFNDDYLKELLENYDFKNEVDINKIYKYSLIKLYENLKAKYVSESDKPGIKEDIISLKRKLNLI